MVEPFLIGCQGNEKEDLLCDHNGKRRTSVGIKHKFTLEIMSNSETYITDLYIQVLPV